MNILIVNQPLNNRGDESAHRALVRSILKYIPEANIRVLWMGAPQSSVDQFEVKSARTQYINIYTKHMLKAGEFLRRKLKYFLLWRMHPYVKRYISNFRWADAVVCAPGGICMGGFMNWGHENSLLCAMKFHKPVFYYGRSIGPFWDDPEDKKVFKQRAIQILKYSSFVSLREAESVRIAYNLGIKDVVETVDTAFLDHPEVKIPEEISSRIGKSPYVIFVPNSLIWHYFYKGKATHEEVVAFWCKAVDIIKKHYPDHKMMMLPQTFNQDSENDYLLFKDIERNRPNADIIVTSDIYSSDIQQQIIRGADAMFGSRYHSVVFAINNNVPFIAFSYEHKIAGLLEELGLRDEMIDIKGLFTSSNFNQSVLDKFDAMVPTIHTAPDAQKIAREKALEAFKEFKKALIKS